MTLAGKSFRWAVLALFTLITLLPLLWLVMSSFKTQADVFADPF